MRLLVLGMGGHLGTAVAKRLDAGAGVAMLGLDIEPPRRLLRHAEFHLVVDPTTVLNAAVFTTQNAERMIPALRTAEQAAPLPVLTDATVCTASALSPCDDGTALRRCNPVDDAFTEIHGHLALPIFQRGTAPYEEPTDAELHINTADLSPEEAAQEIILHIEREGFIGMDRNHA